MSSITENRNAIDAHIDNLRGVFNVILSGDALELTNKFIDGVCTPLLDKAIELEAIIGELYDALERLVRYSEHPCNCGEAIAPDDLFDQAKAALAKARGDRS